MSIETILGTSTKLVLVSQTHGSVRVPLNQNFDYTPRFTSRTIFEFDRSEAAINVSLFEGADVRFEYLDTESKLVDAMVNDTDPAATIVADNPSDYNEITVYANVKNSLGVIFQSVLAKGVRIKGSATTETTREESRVTREGDALNVLRIKGGAIEYSRALKSGSTAFPQGAANDGADTVRTDTGTSTYDLANTPEDVKVSAEVTRKYLVALINGTDNDSLDTPYGIAFSGTGNKTVTITPALGANDVFELFTVYIPV